MHPVYPVQRICRHEYEPFQLTFARHALQVLPQGGESAFEATHKGLVLRGETEASLERAVEVLKDHYGNHIRVGPAEVRYRQGLGLEEPHMGVRVLCPPVHFRMVEADLVARGGTILDAELASRFGVVRATAPLANLLGYVSALSELTAGTAREVMWLSHYAPVRPPPGGEAA